MFPCNRWLSRKEDDGEIVRELVPTQITEEKLRKDGSMRKKEVKQETLSCKTADGFKLKNDGLAYKLHPSRA